MTNNGNGGFGFNVKPNVGVKPYMLVAADLNGGGKMDLAGANFGANSLTVHINTSI